ncbi:uncharacterized protein LOC114379148 isoform X1 [Glycine soja]|uniref:uncharacterized protein LOC114379148 isoform X1 n=1 Tax=Glycine soja TaxID=3848 RepID=UPI00104003A2|nr:uncharacterized protein LOC114379148 isoform X1 [Glycine soja]
MGLKAIFDGKLAVLLLSGGQVHRTKWTGDASSSPKLPSKLHKNTTIVACVPKKVHIEGAGETGFKISSIEITDAIKAGLDEPIQPEPEIFPWTTKANATEKVTNLKLHLKLRLFLAKVIFLAYTTNSFLIIMTHVTYSASTTLIMLSSICTNHCITIGK